MAQVGIDAFYREGVFFVVDIEDVFSSYPSKRSWQKKRSKRSYRSNRSCTAVCIRPAAVVQSSQKEAAAYDQTAYRARQDPDPGRAGA